MGKNKMNRLAFVFVLVFVAVLSFVTPVDAQVMGAVIDTNWNPISGAHVTISHVDPVQKTRFQDASTFTDEGGRYDLRRYDDQLFSDGEYLVEIQAFGSQVKRIDVQVRSGYAYVEDVFLVQDMPGLGIELYVFNFDEGSYVFWTATRNGRSLSSGYTLDTVFQGPAITKAWSQFSRRSSGGTYAYVFIPKGAIPEGSTFWGNVTIRSSRSDLRVYSQDNWFSFTPGQESPYGRKGDASKSMTTGPLAEALTAARAKVASGR